MFDFIKTNLDKIIFLILLVMACVLVAIEFLVIRKFNNKKNISKTNKLVHTGALPNFDKDTRSNSPDRMASSAKSPNKKYMSLPSWIRNSNDCDYD